jgi:hypothetical protein
VPVVGSTANVDHHGEESIACVLSRGVLHRWLGNLAHGSGIVDEGVGVNGWVPSLECRDVGFADAGSCVPWCRQVWGAGLGLGCLEFEVWGLRFEVLGWVWGLGFEVRGLGFGAWGLE